MRKLLVILFVLCLHWIHAPIELYHPDPWYFNLIQFYCAMEGLPIEADEIIRVLIAGESGGLKRKVEWKNDRQISFGLTQASYESYSDFLDAHGWKSKTFREDLFQPAINIACCCWHMKRNYEFYHHDWRMTLSAWNLGRKGLADYTERTGLRYYPPYIKHLKNYGLRLK